MQSGWLDQRSPPSDREEDTKVNILLHHPESNFKWWFLPKDQTLGSKHISKDSSKDNLSYKLFQFRIWCCYKGTVLFCLPMPTARCVKLIFMTVSICTYRDYIFFCLQVQWRRDPIQLNGHRVRQKDDIWEKNCRAPDPAYWGEWQPKSWFECRVTCAFPFLPEPLYMWRTSCVRFQSDIISLFKKCQEQFVLESIH